ncbi:unnamed protein product, partial [Mesorhabditis spiculigera]
MIEYQLKSRNSSERQLLITEDESEPGSSIFIPPGDSCSQDPQSVPPSRPNPPIWFPRWLANLLNIFVGCLVIAAGELAINIYIPSVYSEGYAHLARFMVLQILLNLLAIRLGAHKDNPCYQMKRLHITSERLQRNATQTYRDDKGEEVKAYRWCPPCDRLQPFRTVHCPFCGTCSFRNDHHCFFVTACIGIFTLRFFIQMAFWLFLVGVWSIQCFFEQRRDKADDDGTWASYFTSLCPVVVDVLGVHALGFNMFRWLWEGYRPTFSTALPWVSYILGAVAAMAGSSILAMETFFLYKGYAMMEFFVARDKPLKGDRGISLYSRVKFVLGDRFYLNWLLPPFWSDVNWTSEFKKTHFYEPFRTASLI